MASASLHFAMIADLQIAVRKIVKEVIPKHAFNPRVSVSALHAVEVANRFALLFEESMSNHENHASAERVRPNTPRRSVAVNSRAW